jgi:hypothetical protein
MLLCRVFRAVNTLSRLARKNCRVSCSVFALKPVAGVVAGRYDEGIHCSIVEAGGASGL